MDKIYYDGFGIGEADFCIVADDEGKVIGAVWTRIRKNLGQDKWLCDYGKCQQLYHYHSA